MLLSKDAISDVLEVIKPADHYRPAHQIVHETILDLYSRGEPADAVTVAAELTKKGDIGKVGGAPYLHTLIASVPTAANAGYYARIVRERAVLRRLVEVGTRIVQLGYAGDADADELVDLAQAEVYGVTERRVSDDYLPLSEIMPGALVEIEAIGSRGGTLTGVPTGFADLDALTNGLHPGQMIVVAARPAMGKALALDTPLATPTGWTTMGAVQVGDELYDADGWPTRVVAATAIMWDRPCYEVEFSDGTTIIADAQHQWLTETRDARRSGGGREAIATTEQILATLTVGAEERSNHSIRNAAPLRAADADLPIPPYALGAWLGAWLGEGHSDGARLTSETSEIPALISRGGDVRAESRGGMLYALKLAEAPTLLRDCHADHGSFTALLRTLGVLGDKHVPSLYLRASEAQRRDLLAGLMDTDGTVVRGVGSCQFAVTNEHLADTVYELIVSLGYRCGRTTKRVHGRSEASSTCFILNFSTVDDVFRLQRKHLLHVQERPSSTVRIGRRYVKAVRPVASVPVRCVRVDNAEHLYLAGRSMVPTHNSTLALDFARAAAIKAEMPTIVFSLEMGRSEIAMRLMSAEAAVPLQNMRKGTLDSRDWTTIASTRGRIDSAPLYIDDSPNMTLVEIRAKCRRL